MPNIVRLQCLNNESILIEEYPRTNKRKVALIELSNIDEFIDLSIEQAEELIRLLRIRIDRIK